VRTVQAMEPEPSEQEDGPTLALVPAVRGADPRLGRAALVGGVMGFAAVAVAVTAIALAVGQELVPALGLAAFVASWSGIGFGFMLGASISAGRHLHR
jgi:hypothetical protein